MSLEHKVSSCLLQRNRLYVLNKFYLFYHPSDISGVLLGQQNLLDKKGGAYDVIRRHAGEGLFTREADNIWRDHKQIMAPLYTHFDQETLYQKIDNKVEAALSDPKLGISRTNSLIYPHSLIKALSLQVNMDISFGRETSLSEAAMLAGNLFNLVKFIERNFYFAGLPEFLYRVSPRFYPLLQRAEKMVRVSSENIMFTSKSPLVQGLKERFTKQEVSDEIITILASGHGTIATAVTNTLHLLGLPENRSLQNQIQVTLRGNTVHGRQLLEAVFKESLRLYPPVYMIIRRAEGDISISNELGSVQMPKGAYVALSPYLTHRHPAFWPEAEEFNPSRFLQDKKFGNEYIPFGLGKRRCIGEHLAMVIGPGILASVLSRMKLTTGQRIRPQFAATLRPTKNLKFLTEPVWAYFSGSIGREIGAARSKRGLQSAQEVALDEEGYTIVDEAIRQFLVIPPDGLTWDRRVEEIAGSGGRVKKDYRISAKGDYQGKQISLEATYDGPFSLTVINN